MIHNVYVLHEYDADKQHNESEKQQNEALEYLPKHRERKRDTDNDNDIGIDKNNSSTRRQMNNESQIPSKDVLRFEST